MPDDSLPLHALIFDGPGQGAVRGLAFRYDWEAVIMPGGRLRAGPWRGLPGERFGDRSGAHRAARGQRGRLPGAPWFDNPPPEEIALFESGDKAALDADVAEGLAAMPQAVGFDIQTEVKRHDLAGMAAPIRCPVLVTDPGDEERRPGQSQELSDALICPKTLVCFTAAAGAAGHCEPLCSPGANQRIFDWPDATLAAAR